MNVLDLFSGIGGFSLGLERAGMKTVAFCEIDKFCRKVLKKNFPGVPIFTDIRKLNGKAIKKSVGTIDVICGGFPCQDISAANAKAAGITGRRSGLWKEYKRLICEVQPRFAIMENVSALLSRGLDVVLGDLAEIGFDAEWHCIPASSVGLPHARERVWIVAYSQRLRLSPLFYEIKKELDNKSTKEKETIQPSACIDMGEIGKFHYPQYLRVVDGISKELALQGMKQIGNAVVPAIPEIIGKAIMQVRE